MTGVDEANGVTTNCVRTNCVGVKSDVGVLVFCPTRVGVDVKVDVGTIGVKVGAAVGVFVIVGAGVDGAGLPKN